jgi:hypothetical protein
MSKILLFISLFVLSTSNICMAGWADVLGEADRIISNRPSLPASTQQDEAPARQTEERPVPGIDDEHFIQKDDYFVQKHGLDTNAWIYVDLAKMVTPPSAETKREAEFMIVRDGQNYWTRHFWKTRIASKNELKLGLHVIAFNDNNVENVYKAPDKKDSARGGAWFYAKITDTSDMFRGFVTVSGNYKVGVSNLRVIVK